MKTTESGTGTPQKKGAAFARPESLDDYIRVTSPPVWATLIGVLVLVLGVFVWAVLGQIKTEVRSTALAESGTLICYVPLQYSEYINAESTVTVAGKTLPCGDAPIRTVLSTGEEAKLLSKHGIDPAGVVALELPVSADDGLYDASLVVETVSPLKLILG